ncbi:cell division protein PerM [Leucobacter chromiiresistens]
MRSLVTAVIAAIEAVAVALAGIAVVAIPAVLIWVITFGLAAEPAAVAADVTGVWLLAHFVPLHFSVSAEAALSLGLAPEALDFTLSLAPLGITLISVLLALRAGWRFAGRGGVGAMGVLGGVVGFGAVALVASVFAAPLIEWTSMQAALSAASVYGVASAAAFLVRAGRDGHPWWEGSVRQALRAIEYLGVRSGAALPSRAAELLRLAAAALALVFGIAAVAFAVAVATGYADVTALAQSLQLDPIGSLTLFLVQVALMPIAIVWSVAWMSGTGFAIGAGSSVTPFETLLGPLPALPMLGVLPDGWGERGAFAPGALVVAALVLGVLFARRPALRRASWPAALVITVLAAALVGLCVAGASALATGSLGPDRLASNGPDAWLTGGVVALEVGGGLLIGVIAGRFDAAKVRAAMPDAIPGIGGVRGARPAAAEAPGAPGAPDADADVDFEAAVDEALELGADRRSAATRWSDAGRPDAFGTEAFETGAVDTEAHDTDAFETDAFETEALETGAVDTEAHDTDAHEAGVFDTESFETEELARPARGGARPGTAADPRPGAAADATPGADELTDEAALLQAYAWDAESPTAPADEEPPETERRPGWRWPGRGR